MEAGDEVRIYCEGTEVGRVTVGHENTLVFHYSTGWLESDQRFPLSMVMPLSPKALGHSAVDPWLANLLPEGDALTAISNALGMDSCDTLPTLCSVGGDTAGALSINDPSVQSNWRYIPLADWYGGTEEEALERHLEHLSSQPFFAGEKDIRIVLSGDQPKSTLTVLDEGGFPCLDFPGPNRQLAIPAAGAPSTIVLKTSNPSMDGDVEIEAYCLALASLVGIPTAKARIMVVNERKALAVIRYDRRIGADGLIRRVHQEDLAQANMMYPSRKFGMGPVKGVDIKGLLATRRFLSYEETQKLVDQLVFRVLTADRDLHAKNCSLLLEDETTLAPLYDCTSSLLGGRAEQFGGEEGVESVKQRLQDVAREDWDQIAPSAGVSPVDLKCRIQELSDEFVRSRNEAVDIVANQAGVSITAVEHISRLVEENALAVASRTRTRSNL